jgi:hypothetical protein
VTKKVVGVFVRFSCAASDCFENKREEQGAGGEFGRLESALVQAIQDAELVEETSPEAEFENGLESIKH